MKIIVNIPDEVVRGLALGFMINQPSLGTAFVEKVQDTSEIMVNIDDFPAEVAEKEQLFAALSCLALTQIMNEIKPQQTDKVNPGTDN